MSQDKHTYINGCVCVECKKVNVLKNIDSSLRDIASVIRRSSNR